VENILLEIARDATYFLSLHVALPVLVACAALAGVVLLRERPVSSPGDRAPFGPPDAIPSGVELLATVDVEALRRTENGAAIAREGRHFPDLGSRRGASRRAAPPAT